MSLSLERHSACPHGFCTTAIQMQNTPYTTGVTSGPQRDAGKFQRILPFLFEGMTVAKCTELSCHRLQFTSHCGNWEKIKSLPGALPFGGIRWRVSPCPGTELPIPRHLHPQSLPTTAGLWCRSTRWKRVCPKFGPGIRKHPSSPKAHVAVSAGLA